MKLSLKNALLLSFSCAAAFTITMALLEHHRPPFHQLWKERIERQFPITILVETKRPHTAPKEKAA